MIDLGPTIRLLEVKREELLNQVQAIDKALAALRGSEASVSLNHSQPEVLETPPITVLKPKKTLSPEHKRAMIEGRRRAHEAKRAAALGQEVKPEPFVPALAQPDKPDAEAREAGADGGASRRVLQNTRQLRSQPNGGVLTNRCNPSLKRTGNVGGHLM